MADKDWRRDYDREAARDWEQDDERRWRGRGPQRSERYADPLYGREPVRERRDAQDQQRSFERPRDYDQERRAQRERSQWDEPGSRAWQRHTPWDVNEQYPSSDNASRNWQQHAQRSDQGRWSRQYDDSTSQARPLDATWTYYEFWLTPGPYTGRGPSGYRRNSERIKEDVCDRLESHGEIEASQIQVEANEEGEVTLTGTVQSRRQKRLADDVAESVRGVKDVHNQLKVKTEESSR